MRCTAFVLILRLSKSCKEAANILNIGNVYISATQKQERKSVLLVSFAELFRHRKCFLKIVFKHHTLSPKKKMLVVCRKVLHHACSLSKEKHLANKYLTVRYVYRK